MTPLLPDLIGGAIAVGGAALAFTSHKLATAGHHRAPAPTWAPPVPAIPSRPEPTLDPAGLGHIVVGFGVTDNGTPTGETWALDLLATHLLIGGLSGAGKSGVIWSTMDGLAPYIGCGLAEVWAIDPKGGQELTLGSELFTRYEYRTWDSMAKLLADAVKAMQDRQRLLVGVLTRKHSPSVEMPQTYILVDEMTVLAEIPDTKIRNHIAGSLFMLLAQGRAAGFTVIAAGQDIRKERLKDRPMFATAVGLRMERIQVDMLLGEGARDRGAYCDQIPRSLPGVGYVMVDGGDPKMVRAYWNDDEQIHEFASRYGRARV